MMMMMEDNYSLENQKTPRRQLYGPVARLSPPQVGEGYAHVYASAQIAYLTYSLNTYNI